LGTIWKKLFIVKPLRYGKADENKMGVFNPPKKRNVKLITLAVVCIILAAGLVGVSALYFLSNENPTSDLQSQITQKDNTIAALQSEVASLQAQVSQSSNSSTDQISQLNTEIATLNSQLGAYYNIATMNASDTLVYQQALTQDANSTTAIFSSLIYYSGYITVQATATANTTFVEVDYNYAGADFTYNKTIGVSGTALFPVLPGELQIVIGNINQADQNNATITASYYY
jgi:hypothetical protein